MTRGTYKVEVDWDNDGSFTTSGDDITNYVMSCSAVRGRNYASQLTGRSDGGRFTATLRNLDGRFNSQYTSGPYYNRIRPGLPVRWRQTSPYTRTIWQGFMDFIHPTPVLGGAHTATLQGVGPLGWVNQQKVKIATQTNIPTGTAFGLVLDAAGWSASARTIDTGQTVMERWWTEKQGLEALRDIETTEHGFAWETSDGKIVFEDRHKRIKAQYTGVLDFLFDYPGLSPAVGGVQQGDELKEIFNYATAQVQRYAAGATSVLWSLAEATPPLLGIGESKDFWAQYPNPNDSPDGTSVASWVTPVNGTDVICNTAADGSGITLGAGISVVKYSNAMKITLNNGYTLQPVYVTTLQARGSAITALDPLLVVSEDAASQAKFGKREYPDKGPFIPSQGEAQDWCNLVTNVYKDLRPSYTVRLDANRSANEMRFCMQREISDLVELIFDSTSRRGTGLGLNGNFYIESMAMSMDSNRVLTGTIQFSPAVGFQDFWVLDLSLLGINTKVGY